MKDEILPLFRDVLLVYQEMDLLGGTFFALDGLKLPSNASKEWSGTRPELHRKKERLEAKVRKVMEEHMQKDQGDDNHPGPRGPDRTNRESQVQRRHPDRLLYPQRRTNRKGSSDPGWKRISWDAALETTVSSLTRIAEESGPEAAGFCVTTPSGTAIADGLPWISRLANAFGSPNLVWTTHVCNWHRDFGPATTFGSGIGMPDFSRTGCLLLWRLNPPATWLAMVEEIKAAQRRGMKLIVIDPRKAGFAKHANLSLQLRPGADGILALALANQLLQGGRYDREFLRAWTTAPFLVREDSDEFLLSAEGQKMVWIEGLGQAVPAPPPGSSLPLALAGQFEAAMPDRRRW